MDIGKNIRLRRKQLKMTQEQLALEAYYDAGGVSRIENGKQNFPLQKLNDFARALKCKPADLVAEEFLPNFHQNFSFIPYLNDKQLNEQKFNKDEIKEWIAVDDNLSVNAFAYRIKDNRMLPDLKNGSTVIINTAIKPTAGDIVIAECNGVVTISKFRSRNTGNGEIKFELQPLNNDYETLYSWECSIRLLGVVVEYREKKR